MQLTLYSDYSLRVLLYLCGTKNELSTINEISQFYGISKNHLVKVVHRLGQLGYIISVQGKGGGIKLAEDTKFIKIGELIRKTEPNFHLVECFNAASNQCVITHVCRLKGVLNEGMQAFFKTLDQYSLQDIATLTIHG